jgi:hypothetical protein
LPRKKVGFKIFKKMEGLNLTSENYNQYIMQEVGRTIAFDPQKIIDLLESNDFDVDSSITPVQLGDFYLRELPFNDGLKLGTAYLVEKQNSSFTGAVVNENIYFSFDALSNYWDEAEEDEEEMSNALGLIGGIVKGGLGVTNKAMEAQQKKKYGALDLAQKQADSRNALIQGIISQKRIEAEAVQKQAELNAKKKRIMIISIASVVGIVAVLGTVLYIKSKRNG